MLVRTSNFLSSCLQATTNLKQWQKTLCHFCTILLFRSLSACQRHAPWKFLRNCLTYNFLIIWVKGTKSDRCMSPGDGYKRRQFSESCNLIFTVWCLTVTKWNFAEVTRPKVCSPQKQTFTLLTAMSTGGSHRRIVHLPSLTNFVNTQLTFFISCNTIINNNFTLKNSTLHYIRNYLKWPKY